MAKKIDPPVEVVMAQKSGLSMVLSKVVELVAEVRALRAEGDVDKYKLNEKRAQVEGILLGAIVSIKGVLGK